MELETLYENRTRIEATPLVIRTNPDIFSELPSHLTKQTLVDLLADYVYNTPFVGFSDDKSTTPMKDIDLFLYEFYDFTDSVQIETQPPNKIENHKEWGNVFYIGEGSSVFTFQVMNGYYKQK